MDSSLFAEIIKTFAGIHQEQHQAILELRATQSEPFQKPAPRSRGFPTPPSSPSPSPMMSPLTLPLSTQVEPSVSTRTVAKPGQVRRRGGEAGHFQDQHSFLEVGILIRIPDAPQASPD